VRILVLIVGLDVVKRVIEGKLFHEIEKLGNRNYVHVGFRDKEGKFGDMIEGIVPEVGMTKKVRLTIEFLEED